MIQSTFPPFSVDDFANNPVISMIGMQSTLSPLPVDDFAQKYILHRLMRQ